MGTGVSESVVGIGELTPAALLGPGVGVSSEKRREPGDGSVSLGKSWGTLFTVLGGVGFAFRVARDVRFAFFGLDRDTFGRAFGGAGFTAGGVAVSTGACAGTGTLSTVAGTAGAGHATKSKTTVSRTTAPVLRACPGAIIILSITSVANASALPANAATRCRYALR